MTPHAKTVFHIANPEDAERLRGDGFLAPSSLDAEGFVHCSTAAQVVVTTARHFDVDAELVLLELDVETLGEELRWSEVYPGERFPHLYGPIPAAAVVAVHPWASLERERWPGS